MIHYRTAVNPDLAHLRDLDLKCHEESPQSAEWWAEMSENPNATCHVGCKSHVPVSMIVWEQQSFRLPSFSEKRSTIHIHKICVRKEFRKQRIASRLLAYAHEYARANSCPYMSVSVPEYRCNPDSPDDVSGWLKKLKFKASIILPEKISLYGCKYDRFLFIYEMKL